MSDAASGTTSSGAAPRRGIRVFIAEDHRVTLWGLQRLIEGACPRMEVVGTASTRAELLGHPALADADVLLLDLDLAGDSSIEALPALLRQVAGRVLVLTGEDDTAAHRAAVLKGARGVVHKREAADTVLRAIEKVHAGEVWLERGMLADVLGTLTGAAPPRAGDEHAKRIASLTPREREIVARVVGSAGAKLLALADELGMSENTLRNHLTTVYSKLAVRGRLELHVYASEHGLAAAQPPRPKS